MVKISTEEVLFEVGTEEIPARFIPPAIQRLKSLTESSLKERHLEYGEQVETHGTPRRLVVYIPGVYDSSGRSVVEVMGPSVQAGKDPQGNYTPAAIGFARKYGFSAETLHIKKTEKGEYFCIRKETPSEPAQKILPEIFSEILTQMAFPKTMVWEASLFRFARPIRNLLLLYGIKPLKMSVAGVKSGVRTTGLDVWGGKQFVIPSANRYFSFLRNHHCVIVNEKDRRHAIEKLCQQALPRGKMRIRMDTELLDEVVHLVECPSSIFGSFDKKFLALPEELLVTVMRKQQKFFPIEDPSGKLAAHFIGVRNGESKHEKIVREGYERVLSARLADANFVFHRDLAVPLEKRVSSLRDVTFQEKLGSIWDRTQRIVHLTRWLGSKLGLSGEVLDRSEKIAVLCKADLATEIVGEFPELEGVAGRILGLAQGIGAEVSQGLEKHRWPLTAQGALPPAAESALVSLADKLDLLAGDFAVGLIPSGSEDPYGLRRASVGLLRIFLEREWRLDLPEAISQAASTLPVPQGSGSEALLNFIKQRYAAFAVAEGFRSDEVESILSVGFSDVWDTHRRLKAISDVRALPDFEPLSVAYKRASHILIQAREKGINLSGVVREDLLSEGPEKNLWIEYQKIFEVTGGKIERGEYRLALEHMVRLRPAVDQFFDKVMVMDKDHAQRDNRLALLSAISQLFLKVADFSRIQVA